MCDIAAVSISREGDELEDESKIVVVDYDDLGDITSVSLTYTKNGGILFGIGSGTDEWKLDYIVIWKEEKQ